MRRLAPALLLGLSASACSSTFCTPEARIPVGALPEPATEPDDGRGVAGLEADGAAGPATLEGGALEPNATEASAPAAERDSGADEAEGRE